MLNILFMCVANSARSQMAEGLAKKMFPGARVESAGSQPKTLNPLAQQVLSELGIDIGQQYSKAVADLPLDFVESIDLVITLCAEEVCPVLPSNRAARLHWPLPDPASESLQTDQERLLAFREVREAIQSRLIHLQREIEIEF